MMDISKWNIFIQSNLLLLVFLILLYLVGSLFTFLCNRLFGLKISASFFKCFFYGILLSVYFFALFKSKYLLNSIFLSGIPLCIIIYEYYLNKKLSVIISEKKYNYKSAIISVASIFIILLAKFYFYFSNDVNLGYGDYSFYHSISKHLLDTGVETINIQVDINDLKPGFIYHYWDLWFLSFGYFILDLFNHFGLFTQLNYFETYTLVVQPALFIIIFLGVVELANRYLDRLKLSHNIIYLLPILVSIVLLIRINEFSVLIHPKQFIIGSFLIFFLLELENIKSFPFIFIIFFPSLLFYYPLPGSMIIFSFFICMLFSLGIIRTLKSAKFYYSLFFIICTLLLYYYYFFQFASTCLPETKGETISIQRILYYVFIYNGYHAIFSPNGPIICLNLFLLLYSYHTKRKFNKSFLDVKFIYIVFVCLTLFFIAHFIAGILFMVPEQFQFYNNDYYIIAILLLIDILLVINFFKKRIFIGLFSIVSILSFFICVNFYFNYRPDFYSAIKLKYVDYLKLKDLRNDKFLSTESNQKSSYQISDILYSIFNRRVEYSKDLCNNENVKPKNKNEKVNKQIVNKREAVNDDINIIDVVPYNFFLKNDSIFIKSIK